MSESLTCIVCEQLIPETNTLYCSRSCQGKKQGKEANLHRAVSPQWVEEEVDFLRTAYEVNLPVDVIAAQLGRTAAGVYCKANELKLPKLSWAKRPEGAKKLSELRKLWWKTVDDETKLRIVSHPCSTETRQKIGIALKNNKRYKRAMRSLRLRQARSDIMAQLHVTGKLKGGYSQGKRGLREDLGIYVRSSWEANYARYLNFLIAEKLIASWEYEPKRFEFEKIKRGTRSYLPDFKIVHEDGHVDWHEVKGYLTQRGRTAIKRFRKYYPHETLIVIDGKSYKQIEVEFKQKLQDWE